ncbi:alpha/beta hydrolase [Sedimenticola selenatireducens]|uniref:alpha/beta hydrolase n=1 Tax=Sedimenticola selenatireducens TaxID=191960 RepID=UPI00048CC4F4|nr:alpha/beta hydrolase [Sedimenticola selenatireducens]
MLNVILIAAGIYAVLLLIVYLNQSSLLYLPGMPSRELTASPRDIGLIHEDVRLLTDDGVDLHGWYIPTERARGTLLFFHGNAGNISHRLESLQIFHQLGLNVLIFDYRGYGQSQGQPGERGTQLDALAAWHHLVDIRGESPDRIVLFGRSLGGALAAWLAARVQPGALILESAFISVPELAAELYWWLPARLLSRLQYNTRNYLAEVHCPVQVIHSREDEIIPYRHGQSLYEAAHPPRTFLELRGDHNTGFIVSGDNYMRGLETFLTAHLPDPLKEHHP